MIFTDGSEISLIHLDLCEGGISLSQTSKLTLHAEKAVWYRMNQFPFFGP